MPYTPDEAQRLLTVLQAAENPNVPMGDSLSLPLMVALFSRIVTLRDFAYAQAAINNQLWDRVMALEYRLGTHEEDGAELFFRLVPDGTDEYTI